MRKLFALLMFSAVLWSLTSCSPLRNLQDDQVLLNKNIIKSNKPELKEGILAILKQKPNRRILGVFRFHLGVYTLANRGKSTKFKNWVKNTIGEEPVLLDEGLTNKSSKQVQQYLENAGYFNAEVHDTIVFLKKKKANVIYTVTTGKPYTINLVKYKIADPSIQFFVIQDTVNSLLKYGQNFNTGIFQSERERVTTLLKNNGYYEFSQAYIYYDVDTSVRDQKVNVTMNISNTTQIDSLHTGNHERFRIKNVYIQTDYDPLGRNLKTPTDTILYKNYRFVSSIHKLRFKPDALLNRIFIQPDDIYQFQNAEVTYKGLADLLLFKFINIRYEEIKDDSLPGRYLNSFISLTPLPKQDYKVELEGTHNGGNFGIGGNLVYHNKNTFRGAESIELKLKAKIESIPDFADSTADGNKAITLNTYEIGPEMNIRIPRLLWPLNKYNHRRTFSPVTIFNSSYNFQQRPEYKRNLVVFSSGLEFRETRFKYHMVYPAEINYSKFNLSDAFSKKLLEIPDAQLRLYYRSYLITDGRYSFVYNSQEQNKIRDFIFFRFNAEFAGNSLRLFDKINRSNYQSDSAYEAFSLQYAQYFRPDAELRYYQVFDVHSSIVYRLAAGIGFAYLNSIILPYEKTFFAGGANDIRAFRTRTIGPGSYKDASSIEQFGDIKLSANIEYRFDIFRILKGALFMDGGNVWLRKDPFNLEGSRFKADNFLSEIALGTGLGFRLDFTFFIFRIDAGIPLKDPGRDIGDRWMLKDLKMSSVNYNFGIGYPF